jgi:PIN domain nuclease of toxin-antitoxin system
VTTRGGARAGASGPRRVREGVTGPVLLDTAALLWWTSDPSRLSPRARRLLDDPDRALLVSAVSFWEIGVKERRGLLGLPTTLEAFVTMVQSIDRVTVLPVDLPTWLEVVHLAWDHRDPVDRIVVASAAQHRATVVTSDRAIRAFYPDTVW